jgi:trimethylamine--corrinoid protein Co-methyltransferase
MWTCAPAPPPSARRENAKANIIAGQLARRYKLPYRTSNANASNAVDLQAAYETEMATWGAVLGGANLIYHAAGWLEGGLTASYEKLVLDVEILQNMMGFLEPMPFSEDDLGFDAIKSVPAGGHFFGSEHTMARYETAFYQPMLSNWQNYGSWQEAGGHDALERATGIWQQALREYEEPVLDPAIREELDAYMIKRRAEIGAGEP